MLANTSDTKQKIDNCIILVNPYCHQGKGWKRWQSVKQQVYKELQLPVEEVVVENGITTKELLQPFLDPGEGTCIVSAGGDGSIHYLVNYLITLDISILKNLVVGAVGLGSSNDFLKPLSKKINGIPVRINWKGNSISHDIGKVCYLNEDNTSQQKYFIVNASLGVTAKANYNFNNPGAVLRFLKKNATTAAISYTAVNTIIRHQNLKCILELAASQLAVDLSNVNILKIPFVSGSFFYQQNILKDDGKLALNICHSMSRFELINVLTGLQKGKFPDSEKTKDRKSVV